MATPVYIPVVFHIVLPDPAEVTDKMIEDQLKVLNTDFAGLNGRLGEYSGRLQTFVWPFKDPVCAGETYTNEFTHESVLNEWLHRFRRLVQMTIT